MRFLLDTDTVSGIDRTGNDRLSARVGAEPPDQLAMSVITHGEIELGLAAPGVGTRTVERMRGLLLRIRTLPLTADVASHYGRLRAGLRTARTPIGPNDCWIAAHALAEGLTLVTGNDREFARVPGLRVENWTR